MQKHKKRLGQHFLHDKNIINKIIKNLKTSTKDTFIEIGPGKVLTGLVKRILPGSNSFSINSIDDIKKLNNEYR